MKKRDVSVQGKKKRYKVKKMKRLVLFLQVRNGGRGEWEDPQKKTEGRERQGGERPQSHSPPESETKTKESYLSHLRNWTLKGEARERGVKLVTANSLGSQENKSPLIPAIIAKPKKGDRPIGVLGERALRISNTIRK